MIEFYKYHGAGNDFVAIDNRNKTFNYRDIKKIEHLCHRRFGIGANGVLVLQNHPDYDFEMIYIDPDGSIGAMCGNGGRCIVHFAYNILKIIKDPKHIRFLAPDGEHEAEIEGDSVRLKMQDMDNVTTRNNLPFVYCGTTPHNLMFVKNLEKFPVVETGRKIRYRDPN